MLREDFAIPIPNLGIGIAGIKDTFRRNTIGMTKIFGGFVAYLYKNSKKKLKKIILERFDYYKMEGVSSLKLKYLHIFYPISAFSVL